VQQTAVIYARQSEDIAEGIDRQLTRCRSLASARGWDVVVEYTDNDTSASKRRGKGTQWARMLGELREGVAGVVIAVDLDRLLRDTRDLFEVIDTGARVLTVDGEIDLTTADGEFRATMLAGIARFEVRRKSERQLRANVSRIAAGRPVPGRRRYGFETDGATPREAEAVVVRRMFDHISAGGSLRSLARAITAEGVDPSPGTEWSNRRVRDILMNETYAGYVRHLGKAHKSEHVTPIVSDAQATEVRAILRDPGRSTTPGTVPSHLLTGIATCGVCGGTLAYMRAYTCKAGVGGHPSIRDVIIEPFVVAEVVRAIIAGGPHLFPPANGRGIVQLVSEHEINVAKVRETLAFQSEGLIPASTVRQRLIELRDERNELEAGLELARHERSAAASLHDIVHDLVDEQPEGADYAAVAEAVTAKFLALDLDRQRDVLRAVVDVVVMPGRGLGRVQVWHKLVTTLNPGADDPQHAFD